MVMKTLIQYILCNRVSQKILSCISSICRKVARGIHQAQFFAYWGGTSTPEWFDHELDRYAQWGAPKGNCFWVERGVFSLLAIEPGAKILELCCGYGFNAKHFYAYKASSIVSCDFDPTAIAYAKTEHSNEKTEYIVADIRYNMPQGKFDNIVWDAAIEHFTPEEIESIMKGIKERLGHNGRLSGYTIVERADGHKSLEQHEYEFKSKEDLMRFLTPHFAHVKVFETIYENRHNLYFYASYQGLPFDPGWEFMVNK